MKKEMLVSALLLANPLAALANDEIAIVKKEALESSRNLLAAEFRSIKTYQGSHWVWNETKKDSDLVNFQLYLTVKFLAPGVKDQDYTFDGEGSLDYEVVVSYVDIATGESFGSDNTYYVKKETSSKLRFFDCDSTRRCDSENANSKAYLFNSDQGKVLKIKNSDIYLPQVPETEKEVLFFEVK